MAGQLGACRSDHQEFGAGTRPPGVPVGHDLQIALQPAPLAEAFGTWRCYAAAAGATTWRTARLRLEASLGRLTTMARPRLRRPCARCPAGRATGPRPARLPRLAVAQLPHLVGVGWPLPVVLPHRPAGLQLEATDLLCDHGRPCPESSRPPWSTDARPAPPSCGPPPRPRPGGRGALGCGRRRHAVGPELWRPPIGCPILVIWQPQPAVAKLRSSGQSGSTPCRRARPRQCRATSHLA